MTGKKVILITMPIRQSHAEHKRARTHIADLEKRFENVKGMEIDLTNSFDRLKDDLPDAVSKDFLSMANARARLRMLTLYAVGQTNRLLVAGTGNKVEDFGVGFYTKYGDGGVDISPIADLMKTEVWACAKEVGVIEEIVTAKPTDGLWDDGRSDEDQICASYPELEWAMTFDGNEEQLHDRQKEVLAIFRKFNRANKHKMLPIPVCTIPEEYK